MSATTDAWTVGKASWIHQEGFEWAIFVGGVERGSFKSEAEAQEYCDKLNRTQSANWRGERNGYL